MTTAEQLEQWRGRAVVDADGDDLGKLDDVYYGSDGEAVLARVRSGLMGRHQSVVPLAGSSVSRDYLRLAYRREQIEQAGRVAAGEYLDASAAMSLGQAYGLVLPGSELGYETSANLQGRRGLGAREGRARRRQREPGRARRRDRGARCRRGAPAGRGAGGRRAAGRVDGPKTTTCAACERRARRARAESLSSSRRP
jgi:hypothetical protein